MARNKAPKRGAKATTHSAHRYTVGFNEVENRLIEEVTALKGVAVGTYARMVTLEAARRDLQQDGTDHKRER